MRLDLFLKASRLIKRRAIAREMCENGRVHVNSHEAKPAKEVRQGDVVTLTYSSRVIEVEVLIVLPVSSKKIAGQELYGVKSDRRLPNEKDVWSENLS